MATAHQLSLPEAVIHQRNRPLRRAGPGDLTNRDQRSRLPRLRTTQQPPQQTIFKLVSEDWPRKLPFALFGGIKSRSGGGT